MSHHAGHGKSAPQPVEDPLDRRALIALAQELADQRVAPHQVEKAENQEEKCSYGEQCGKHGPRRDTLRRRIGSGSRHSLG